MTTNPPMSLVDILEHSARQLEADKRTLGVEAAIEMHDRQYTELREARKERQELELLAAERKEERRDFSTSVPRTLISRIGAKWTFGRAMKQSPYR